VMLACTLCAGSGSSGADMPWLRTWLSLFNCQIGTLTTPAFLSRCNYPSEQMVSHHLMRWRVSALPRLRASYLGLSTPVVEAPLSTGFHSIYTSLGSRGFVHRENIQTHPDPALRQ
jgi:hypothetical protein